MDVDQKEINKIKQENQFDINWQCHTMLSKLARKLGSSFTKSKLVEALRECDLNDTADRIAPMTEKSLQA